MDMHSAYNATYMCTHKYTVTPTTKHISLLSKIFTVSGKTEFRNSLASTLALGGGRGGGPELLCFLAYPGRNSISAGDSEKWLIEGWDVFPDTEFRGLLM
jgi:hypothetical protein